MLQPYEEPAASHTSSWEAKDDLARLSSGRSVMWEDFVPRRGSAVSDTAEILDVADIDGDYSGDIGTRSIKTRVTSSASRYYASTIGRLRLKAERVKVRQMQKYKKEEGHPFPRLLRIHKSTGFEIATALLIVSNCICIGWQAEQRNPDASTKLIMEVIEHFFTAAFLIELMVTAFACGWTIVMRSEFCLDIFLVTLSVSTTWIMKPLELPGTKLLRKLTVLRILRLIRLARAVRMRPEFKEMWSLLKGVAESGETLFWTYIMIFCVLYFFAIMATSLIGKADDFKNDELAQEHFGDVLLSMLTLFQVMTLDSWTSIMRPLMARQPFVVFFFIVFISIAEFVLMNLITAVIVEHAFADAKAEENEKAKQMETDMENELKDLQNLFDKIDEDQSGKLSRGEMERAMMNKKVRQKLGKLDIKAKDLNDLWEILDDGDGELDSEEFVQGIRRLQGEARSKDILRLYREVRVLEHYTDQIEDNLARSNERMQVVQAKLHRARVDVAAAQRTMVRAKESVKLAAQTQPLQ